MISIITGIIGIIVAAMIITLMRRDRLHANHGLSWLVVASVFALLGFAPTVIDKVAIFLGIAYPPVLALTLGIALLVIKILLMDIERSNIEVRNQRLIQRVAMLEADLRKMQKSLGEPGTPDMSTSDKEIEDSGNLQVIDYKK